MANEEKKDFNAMLLRDNGMPKIQIVTDEATIKKYGGNRMYFAPPRVYDELMKRVPPGKVITVGAMREYLARQNGADFTDPITAGIFVSIGRLGKPSAGGESDALLADPQGRRGAQPQIPRRHRGPEAEA